MVANPAPIKPSYQSAPYQPASPLSPQVAAQPNVSPGTPGTSPQTTDPNLQNPALQALLNQLNPNYAQITNPQQLAQASVTPGLQQIDPALQAFLDQYIAGVVGPSEAQSQQQITSLSGQIGLAGAANQVGTQQAQQDYTNQMGLLGIQQADIPFQQAELLKQTGLTGAEQLFSAGQQSRAAQSGATASGSVNTAGHQQQMSDIQSQLGFQQQQSAIGTQQAEHQLSDMSKQLGISSTEIKQRLTNSLQSLGISQLLTVDQLLQQISQVQQGEYSPIAGLLADIYQMSGVQIPVAGG